MKSFNLSDSDISKHQEDCLGARRESTTESSSGGSGRSTQSEKRPSSHGGVGEIVAAAIAGPQQKLAESERKAQTYVESRQFDAAIRERARCLALARLVFGKGHLRLAEAHAKLAEDYLQLKGWAVQAREHSGHARDILHLCSPGEEEGEKAQTLRCLLSACHTHGQAALALGNLEEAEMSLKTAERIMGDLKEQEGGAGLAEEETSKTEFEIATGLSRIYQRQGRPEVALCQCKRALRLAESRLGTGETCAVYRDMAAIEQAGGRMDRAIRHLQQAHSLAQSRDPGGMEEARIAHSLALAHSTLREPGHKDSALRFFEESLGTYSRIVGPQDALTLSVQDDLCHLLLLIGQRENAVKLQRESLALKRSLFGDLSQEVADTLQLIGGVEMTQGDMRRAHKSMSKCLEIEKLLFGPQHKKTRATQRTVDMLSEAPEVAGRQQKAGSLKTRPPFCAVIPTHNPPGGTNVAPSEF